MIEIGDGCPPEDMVFGMWRSINKDVTIMFSYWNKAAIICMVFVFCKNIHFKQFIIDTMDLHIKNKMLKSIQIYIRNENRQYVKKLKTTYCPNLTLD